MGKQLLLENVKKFLEAREFISVATCDFEARPNVAPKLILKVEKDCLYLVDYVLGRTFNNININPKASISLIDANTLIGYQINGPAEIIDGGKEYEALLKEHKEKQIRFTATRIIEGLRSDKRHGDFETTFPERVVFLKIKAIEIVEIIPTGKLKRRE